MRGAKALLAPDRAGAKPVGALVPPRGDVKEASLDPCDGGSHIIKCRRFGRGRAIAPTLGSEGSRWVV